jgi:eukaryotic-like serine/threonine-protein kinase
VNERSVFAAAMDIADPAERAAYLDQACGQDTSLRQHLEGLLAEQEQLGSFLAQPLVSSQPAGGTVTHVGQPGSFLAPPLASAGPVLGQRLLSEEVETRVGPYKLLQQIGEGGMGVVYMAEQTKPVQRKVALKIIKPGMDSRQVIARFDAERQALALMDHPNIAKVLDAGTTSGEPGGVSPGRPYFVMELVKGVPVTTYCDEHRLTPRERLELFLPVCLAIQHAHQKGIIHRDLKPSNILVAPYDGKPVVKVIDFGVAKATGQRLTDMTLYTEFGAVVGTLEYMSPEQAELNNQDIDTRSDIYSLGVVLYELLTGSTPLDRKRLKQAAFNEMLRIIREEEPQKPSTRLSDSTDSLPSISAQRHMEPAKLTRSMRGEVDWIVMKALEKDRNRRYETTNGFAMDVQRHLAGEPVLAAPASQWYRLRKFVRRHRAALWTTGVVALALLVGTAVSVWQAVRATRAEGLADARLDAERRARQDADTNFQTARKAVDDYFTVVAGSSLLDAPGMEPLRKQLLETAIRYNLEFIRQRSDDPKLQADVAAAHIRVAEITYLVGGRFDQWFPHLRDGVDMITQMIADGRDTPEVQQRLARIHLSFSPPQATTAQPPDIEAVFRYLRQQARNWEKLIRDNPQVPDFQDSLAGVSLYLAQGIFSGSEAASWSDRAIEICEKLKREHPDVQSYRMNLARAYELRGQMMERARRTQQADAAFEKALLLRRDLARESPEKASHSAWLAASYRIVGEAQNARNQAKQAEKTLRQALALLEKLVADFPAVHTYQDELARTQLALATALKKLGQSQEAQAAYRNALAGFEQLVVAFPRATRYQNQLLQTAKELAQLLEASGQSQKKREILDVVFAVYEKLTVQLANTSEDLQAMAALYQNLANLLRDSGQSQEAEKAFSIGLDIREKLATDFPRVDQHVWDLAACYIDAAHRLQDNKRYNEAAKIYERARKFLEARQAQFPEQTEYRAELGRIHNHIGWLLASSGRQNEAEKEHRQALDLYEKLAQVRSKPELNRRHRQELAWTHEWLGHVLTNSNRPQEAEKAFRQVIAVSEDLNTELPSHGYIVTIAKEYGNLATLFIRLSQWDKAEPACREALARWQKLAADFPRESYRVDAGHTLWQLASILSSTGRRDEAETTLREALTLFKGLAADYPRERHYRQETAFSYRLLCDNCAGAGRAREEADYLQRAAEIYATLLAEEPNSDFYRGELSVVYARFAHHFIRLSQWDKAAAQYAKADLLARPLRDDAFAYACLHLIRGDSEGYNRFCQGMIQRAGKTEDRFEAFVLARTCAMARKSPVDPARTVQWANQAVAGNQGAWYFHALGLAQYRAGQFDQALQNFAKANVEAWAYRDLNWFGLALVHLRMGHPDEARQSLDKGIQWLERESPPGLARPTKILPQDWLEAQVLRREAEEMLKIKRSP